MGIIHPRRSLDILGLGWGEREMLNTGYSQVDSVFNSSFKSKNYLKDHSGGHLVATLICFCDTVLKLKRGKEKKNTITIIREAVDH